MNESTDFGLDVYQANALATAVYPNSGRCLLYPVLGLVNEACELAEKCVEVMPVTPEGHPAEPIRRFFRALSTVGDIAGQLKKAWRDDAGSLVKSARDCQIQDQLGRLLDELEDFEGAVQATDVIDLPVLVLDVSARTAFGKEIGDALWYCAGAAYELGFKLSGIAAANNLKLKKRQEAGTLCGSGDNR